MPILYEWLVEDEVLYNRVWGEFTEDEVEESAALVVQHFESATHQVYFLIDTLDIRTFPKNMLRVLPMTKDFVTHQNMRQLIVVSNNTAVKFVTSIAANLQKNKLVLFTNLDDALDYLRKQLPEFAADINMPVT
ncbi:MAG: hypothetical protein IAE80_08775 [Anaerolinea sp.]|nr:hypothetical protein [Anaerolinea sp.]